MDITIKGKISWDCTLAEIQEAFDHLKTVHKYLQAQKGTEFHPGQEVILHSRKHGFPIRGIVDQINKTTISMHEKDTPLRKWRVSPSLLEAA